MEAVRHFRNFVIISIIVVIVLWLCLYFGGIIAVAAVYGSDYLTPEFLKSKQPFDFLVYLFKYWFQNRSVIEFETSNYFMPKLFASAAAPFIILSIILYTFRFSILEWRPFEKKETVHGDARWASEKEIRLAGLRAKKGMLLGRDKKGLLIADGYQHALLFAPTGSGKGVGFAIPNLLFWDQSLIVHDIKLENFELTSGYRRNKMKQDVFLWNPADTDGMTDCYNPLDWISEKPGKMVDDVQKIANLILPEQEFWQNEARSLLVGVILYLHAVPEKLTSFGEVVRTMRSDDVVYNLAVVLDTIGKFIHPVAYMNIAAFLQKAEKERSGVISTMNSGLELWANPIIDAATATSDFDFSNFKKRKTSIFVGITPDNLARLKPLMQVFYQQATEFLTKNIPTKEDKYGVLFMMDEFPTLGEMEQFKNGIAYFRGYNVRLFLIIQDTEQLKGIYEEAGMNSFLSNATYRITFAANNIETANLISQLVGNKTVQQAALTTPKFLDLNPSSRSLNVSEVQRALLLPQEVIMLPKDEQIILVESSPPIKTKKIRYFEDSFFTKKLLPAIKIKNIEPFDPRKFYGDSYFKSQRPSKDEEQQVENNPTGQIEDGSNQDDEKTSSNDDFDPDKALEELRRSLFDDDDDDDDDDDYDLNLDDLNNNEKPKEDSEFHDEDEELNLDDSNEDNQLSLPDLDKDENENKVEENIDDLDLDLDDIHFDDDEEDESSTAPSEDLELDEDEDEDEDEDDPKPDKNRDN